MKETLSLTEQQKALELLWVVRCWLIGPDTYTYGWNGEAPALYENRYFLEQGAELVKAIDKLVWRDPNTLHPLLKS